MAASLDDAEVGHRRSRLVLGSADLRDDSLTPRLLDQFRAVGGAALDVGNVYGDGESELAVGKWLAAAKSREQIVLYGKGCHPPYCRPELVADEVDRALSLLRVDWLDVFMLHRDDPEVPVEAFADALLEQVDAQKILAFGVSNWTLARFRELTAYLDRMGDEHLAVFSNHFSLGEMVVPTWPGCLAVTKEELGLLVDGGVRILAWASLAMGYFAGRHAPSWDSALNEARRQRARELASELGTTPNAVALAYVLHQPEPVHAVIGTRSEAHLAEALAACAIELSPRQLVWLEAGTRAWASSP